MNEKYDTRVSSATYVATRARFLNPHVSVVDKPLHMAQRVKGGKKWKLDCVDEARSPPKDAADPLPKGGQPSNADHRNGELFFAMME